MVSSGAAVTAYRPAGNNIIINPKGSISVDGTVTINGTMTIQANASGTGGLLQGNSSHIIGSVAVQLYVSRIGYHYISSPFSSATVNDINGFTPVNLKASPFYYSPENPPSEAAMPNILKMDEAHTHDILYDYNCWQAPAIGEIFGQGSSVMRGYSINLAAVPPQPLSITKPGADLNNGDKTYNAMKVPTSTDNTAPYYHSTNPIDNWGSTTGPNPKAVRGTSTNGWHLVGNPYPSPVDWDAVASDPANQITSVSSTISYFQPTSRWYGNYGNYQPQVGSSGAVLSPPQTQYIPIMSSFMINNNNSSAVNYTLTFFNKYRTVDPDALGAVPYKKAPAKFPLIRLAAFISDNPQKRDEAVIYFDQFASDEFNLKFDVPKLMNSDLLFPNIYALAQQNRVASKAFPMLSDEMVIPLGFNVNTADKYTIKAADMNNLPSGAHVFIIDTKKNISQDLTISPEYRFNFEGIDESRFFIKFLLKGSLPADNADNEMVFAYSSENVLFVNYSNPDNEMAAVYIYNIQGQLIRDEVKISNGLYSTSLNVAPGVYFVKVITGNKVYAHKIYIHAK